MKLDRLFCTIRRGNDAPYLAFFISDWRVIHYPLTYTIDECVEAWCELVGWKLKKIFATIECVEVCGGQFYFELSRDGHSMDIVHRISRRFNRSLLESQTRRWQRRTVRA